MLNNIEFDIEEDIQNLYKQRQLLKTSSMTNHEVGYDLSERSKWDLYQEYMFKNKLSRSPSGQKYVLLSTKQLNLLVKKV